MTAGAERYNQLDNTVDEPGLYVVAEQASDALLQPSPITDKREVVATLDTTTTAIKQMFHERLETTRTEKDDKDKDKTVTVEVDQIYYERQFMAITTIFKNFGMLPIELSKEEQARYKTSYAKAWEEQSGLDRDDVDDLYDKYKDNVAARAVDLLRKEDKNHPMVVPVSQEYTAPMLRTVFILLRDHLPSEQN